MAKEIIWFRDGSKMATGHTGAGIYSVKLNPMSVEV